MQHWDLRSLDVQPHQPQVLHSEGEGRSIAIQLPAGEALQEHETHERAWVVVVDGEVEIEGEETVRGGAGIVAIFDPHERREVRAVTDARLLLMLGPWPGVRRGA
jgi:redox-sensitive bicupin YhaK (pirin superfamily)